METTTPEQNGSSNRLPWEWRVLDLLSRLRPPDLEPPPWKVLYVGIGAGALEGAITGAIRSGINGVIGPAACGAVTGAIFCQIAWTVRRRIPLLILSLVLGVTIEAIGGWFIVVYISRVRFPPVGQFVGGLIGIALLGLPTVALGVKLITRETVGAFRGMIVGSVVVPIALAIVCGVRAGRAFGNPERIVVAAIFGAVVGFVPGWLLGANVSALVSALINVKRRTIAPTYGGLAVAIILGWLGWLIGMEIADEPGGFLGAWAGVGYGSLAGIKLGHLATPWLLAVISSGDETGPKYPPVIDLSDPRELADADQPQQVLGMVLLLIVRRQIHEVRFEPGESTCRITALPPISNAIPPFPVTGDAVLNQFRQLLANPDELTCPQDGVLRLLIRRCSVDVQYRFERTPAGVGVVLRCQPDADAAEEALRVGRRLGFLLRARQWFSPVMRQGRRPLVEVS